MPQPLDRSFARRSPSTVLASRNPGFAINLGSALIAHLSVGDGPEAWGWAAATGVLWGLFSRSPESPEKTLTCLDSGRTFQGPFRRRGRIRDDFLLTPLVSDNPG